MSSGTRWKLIGTFAALALIYWLWIHDSAAGRDRLTTAAHAPESSQTRHQGSAAEIHFGESKPFEATVPELLARSDASSIFEESDGIKLELEGDWKPEARVEVVAVLLDERARDELRGNHLTLAVESGVSELRVHRLSNRLWQIERPSSDDSIGLVLTASGMHSTCEVVYSDEWRDLDLIKVQMSPSDGMTVRVINRRSFGIAGARVHIRSNDLGTPDSLSVEELFRSRWYWNRLTANEEGECRLLSPPDGLISIYVEPQGPYSASSLWEQEVRELVTVEMLESYTIRGTVRLKDGNPVSDVGLSVFWTEGRWSERPIQATSTNSEGHYLFENLPVDGGVHFIMLHDLGYQPTRSSPFVAKIGEIVSVDLATTQAHQGSVRVLSGFNVPLREVECELVSVATGRVPALLVTDSEGKLEVPGYLQRQGLYFLKMNLHGCPQETESFVFDPELSEPASVTVEGVGELVSLRDDHDRPISGEVTLNYYPRSNSDGYCASFLAEELPVFLPVGKGTLVAEFGDGVTTSQTVTIKESSDVRLGSNSDFRRLGFSIPTSEQHRVWLVNPQRYSLGVFSSATGEYSLEVAPGDYLLDVELGGMIVECGPFSVADRDVELGELDLQGGNGSISGLVLSASGEPVVGIPVIALGPSGFRSDFAITNTLGLYLIEALPAGQYVVELSGAAVFAGTIPDCDRRVFLGCNGEVTDVDFCLGGGEIELWFGVSQTSRTVGALVAAEEFSYSVRGPTCSPIRVPRMTERVIAGFWESSAAGLDVHLATMESLDSTSRVGRQVLLRHHVKVSLPEDGVDTIEVAVRIAKCMIGAITLPVSQGEVVIRTNAPSLIEVQVPDSLGTNCWIPIDLASTEFSVRVVTIVDEEGAPISGAFASVRGSEARAFANPSGQVHLSVSDHDWVWVDHSEFWAHQLKSDDLPRNVTLRRTCEGARVPVEFFPASSILTLRPLFDLGYRFIREDERLLRRDDFWMVPSVPTGEYLLSVQASGQPRQEVRLTLGVQGELGWHW